jgi:hypothetical protein
MKFSQIQPSQLYISSEKLSEVLAALDRLKPDSVKPIPVKKLGDRIVFTEDHTVALASFLRGASEVRVYWEEDELDWDAYEICVDWCEKEGVRTVADLKSRVVSPEKYNVLWLERCRKMQQGLEGKKKQNLDQPTRKRTLTPRLARCQ